MTITDDNTAPPRVRRAPRVKILSREEFITKLRKDDPAANAETIRQQYEIACRARIEDEQTVALVMPYVIEGLRRDVKDPKPPPERRAAKVKNEAVKQRLGAALKEGFEGVVEAAATMRLLEHVTPNGLKLANCTGAMCRNLGGWYGAVSKRLNPRDYVGNHLDEIELHAIAARWRILESRP